MTAPAETALTGQEQRVADLAQRHSNTAIAQLLYITPSTVEQHLTRVYRKLGIRSRAQLAGALADTTGGDQ
jgi:DNA-binding NarL/FixJ family response regulator